MPNTPDDFNEREQAAFERAERARRDLKRVQARINKRHYTVQLVAVVVVFAGMFAIVLGYQLEQRSAAAVRLPSKLEEQLASDIVTLRGQQQHLEEALKAAVNGLPSDAGTATKLTEMQASVSDIQQRMEKLEAAIMATPAKALEVPLLQRDLEHLKTLQGATMESTKASTDRVYDLLKWLVGLAGGGGILSIGLQAFFARKDAKAVRL